MLNFFQNFNRSSQASKLKINLSGGNICSSLTSRRVLRYSPFWYYFLVDIRCYTRSDMTFQTAYASTGSEVDSYDGESHLLLLRILLYMRPPHRNTTRTPSILEFKASHSKRTGSFMNWSEDLKISKGLERLNAP